VILSLTESGLSFYSTASQVIPVLFLAMALEFSSPTAILKFFNIKIRGRVVSAVMLGVMLVVVGLMLVGEVLALGALRNNKVTSDTDFWVMLALVLGLLVVMAGVVERVASETNRLAEPNE
jgi:hypothetical protein